MVAFGTRGFISKAEAFFCDKVIGEGISFGGAVKNAAEACASAEWIGFGKVELALAFVAVRLALAAKPPQPRKLAHPSPPAHLIPATTPLASFPFPNANSITK